MSQWTHVNASIRFDAILGQGLPDEIELGRMCKWEDEDTSHWDSSLIPCGSEGSLEYSLVKTGSENSMACLAIIWTGDLRDYSDHNEIYKYFENVTKGKMIRSGLLEIHVESRETYIYQHSYEHGWKLISCIETEI